MNRHLFHRLKCPVCISLCLPHFSDLCFRVIHVAFPHLCPLFLIHLGTQHGHLGGAQPGHCAHLLCLFCTASQHTYISLHKSSLNLGFLVCFPFYTISHSLNAVQADYALGVQHAQSEWMALSDDSLHNSLRIYCAHVF